jgi:hypothetical protein
MYDVTVSLGEKGIHRTEAALVDSYSVFQLMGERVVVSSLKDEPFQIVVMEDESGKISLKKPLDICADGDSVSLEPLNQ